MPIDFTQFIDLRPLDVQPADIYLDSIAVARTVLPDFSLRVGTPEDAMFQAISYMTALNVGAINRIPNSLMMGITKMIGAPVHEGTRATLTAQITAISTSGTTIPAGTILAYEVVQNDQVVQYLYYTDEILVIDAVGINDPLPSGTVSCTSVTIGLVPDINTDDELVVLSYDQSIYSAKCSGDFANGTSMESTNDFLSRAVTYIQSLSSANTTKNQLQSFLVSAYPDLITRAKVYDLTDPGGTLDVDETDEPGYATIYAYGPNRLLTTAEKTEIKNDAVARSVAGITLDVLDPPLLNFFVNATVLYDSSVTSAALSSQITGNLIELFNPLNSQYVEERLRYNTVLNAIQLNSQVIHVTALSIGYTRTATITGASVSGPSVTYTANNNFSVGQTVTVTGITPSGLNIANKIITARNATTFTVGASGGASGSYSSGGTATVTYSGWSGADGNDLLYDKKGSLLQLTEGNILLTLEAYTN
jgi:hypothetical protein